MDKAKKLIRFDWAIKRLLRNKTNFDILEGLLSSLLGKQIRILRLIESESNRESRDNKFNRVDILAEDLKGVKMLIEVQNETENDYFHRMLFGTSRIVSEYINRGEKYEKIAKVYSINIVYFNLGDGSDYVYHGFTDFYGLHSKSRLELTDRIKRKFEVERVSDIYPEYYILLAKDFDKWSKTPLDQWMYFLSTSTIPEGADAPGLKEARERLRIDLLSPEEKTAYYKHLDNMNSLMNMVTTAWEEGEWKGRTEGIEQGRAEGIKQGRAEGIEEGRAEGIRSIAQKLIAMNLPESEILSATGLTSEEIENLRKNTAN